MLIDSTPKPPYRNGIQVYTSDTLTPLIRDLRNQKTISSFAIASDSRFSVSYNELHEKVLPQLAQKLNLNPTQVRLPKAIEFNLLGNLYYSQWTETDTDEWLEDTVKLSNPFASVSLVGGRSINGGLAYIGYWNSLRNDSSVGFRPLITFPTQK